MGIQEVVRIRRDTWYDYLGIIKSFVWDHPVEIDQHLYLGNYSHCFFFSCLDGQKIKGVVNATNKSADYYRNQNIDYFNIPIEDLNSADISGFLRDSYQFICDHISQGRNVLVHCVFGRSRSVAVCVYYLMRRYGLEFEEAYRRVESKKPFVNINLSFVRQIQESLENS